MATKRFGVDADNVLFNSSLVAVHKINESRGFTDPIHRDDLTKRPFHLSPALVARGISQDEVSVALDNVWRVHSAEIPLMDPNIPSVIAGLIANGIAIDIITTMGARDEAIRPRMNETLERTGIHYDTLHFVSSSSEKLAFPVFTIVDDEQQLALDLAATGRPGIVYDAPWNRDFVAWHESEPRTMDGVVPVKDWTEVGVSALALAKAFRT